MCSEEVNPSIHRHFSPNLSGTRFCDLFIYAKAFCVFSSPAPKALWWAYRIGRPPSSVVPLSVRRPHSLNIFSSETAWQISQISYGASMGWGNESLFKRSRSHEQWPTCPYMVKILKNLLLQNQKADDLEIWYAAPGAQVLPSFFKCRPWVDFDLFYGKVKFGPLCFCMGKR